MQTWLESVVALCKCLHQYSNANRCVAWEHIFEQDPRGYNPTTHAENLGTLIYKGYS